MGGVTNHRRSLRQMAMLALLFIAALLVPQTLMAQKPTQPIYGNGKPDNPYQITTAWELAWFRDSVNNVDPGLSPYGLFICAKLMNDIDMSPVCNIRGENNERLNWTPISNHWRGTFDGNNKTLSNFSIDTDDMDYVGLFGKIGITETHSAVIKNLTIDNARVYVQNSSSLVGILVADANWAIVKNVRIQNSYVVAESRIVGGLAGNFDGELSDCASYASVTNSRNYDKYCITGGLIGIADYRCKLRNVFSYGSVESHCGEVGMLFGVFNKGNAEGLVAYRSDAQFVSQGKRISPVPFGGTKGFSSGVAVGYSASELKTGCAAYLFQKYAEPGVNWGQDIVSGWGIPYPELGSTNKVYIEDEATFTCKGEYVSGSFTNTQPETEGVLKLTHTSATHTYHEGVAATCLADGTKSYYECDYCHRMYADEDMTDELSSTVAPALGHDYYGESDKCSRCGTKIPVAKLGDNTIRIDKVAGDKSEIKGYNLAKFVAPADGDLQVAVVSSSDSYTEGSLWSGDKTKALVPCDNAGTDQHNNYVLNCKITKGETYYIGSRKETGNTEYGDYTLSIKLNGLDYIPCDGIEGDGTAETPFELNTAEQLKWFGEYVKGATSVPSRPTACAKLMNDISLASVCHAAGSDYDTELSWEPISPDSVKWSGTFDGNGKTISDLYINTRQNNIGLFGSIGMGTIKNLNFENATVKANKDRCSYFGILVGKASDVTIQNIKTDEKSSVSANICVGGIAGQLSGRILDCENHAKVTSSYGYTGGICGDLTEYSNSETSSISEIKGCANYGTVYGEKVEVGGIVGYVTNGLIEDCANYAAVGEDTYAYAYVGGVIGKIEGGTIKNVFTNADVTGNSCGLVVGLARASTPNTLSITGLVAFSSDATLTACGKKVEARAFCYCGVDIGTDCVIAFTANQIKSGEVAYKLNGGVTDGTQAWYQKLGDGGDAYPVMAAAEGNTVYKAEAYTCDGQLIPESTPVYANTTVYHTPHYFDKEQQEASGVYATVCSGCGIHKDDKRTIKDFAGEGKNLEITEAEDGSFSVAELTLKDGDPYNSPVTFSVGSLSYDRSFAGNAGKWQALYVPFAVDCSEINDSYEVAAINNFHEYEQNDGSTKVVLEVKKLTSGTLDALTPCVIRLKEGGDATQAVFNDGSIECELESSWGDNANRYIDCSSVTRYYKFTGLLQPKQGFVADQDFALVGGRLFKADSDSRLKAQRWYLSATDRTATAPELASLQSIAIEVVGEGSVTGIDDIYVTTDTVDASSSRRGIYDLQGRKLNEEPASGVYIKDGKKLVK